MVSVSQAMVLSLSKEPVLLAIKGEKDINKMHIGAFVSMDFLESEPFLVFSHKDKFTRIMLKSFDNIDINFVGDGPIKHLFNHYENSLFSSVVNDAMATCGYKIPWYDVDDSTFFVLTEHIYDERQDRSINFGNVVTLKPYQNDNGMIVHDVKLEAQAISSFRPIAGDIDGLDREPKCEMITGVENIMSKVCPINKAGAYEIFDRFWPDVLIQASDKIVKPENVKGLFRL